MKIIYGHVFKKLRINKGYTIKEITDSEISSATISKFEHGSIMISTDKFFRILAKINTSPAEFTSYLSQYLVNFYSFSEVNDYFLDFEVHRLSSIKLTNLIRMVERQTTLFPEMNFLKLSLIALKSLTSQKTSNCKYGVSTRELKTIRQYLLMRKTWCEFELWIYCSTIHLFDLQSIKLLSRKLFSPLTYVIITSDMDKRISTAIGRLSYVLVSDENIRNDNYKKFFDSLLLYLEENPISSKQTLEKAFIKFNIGVYRYYNNQKSYGIREMKKVIKSLSLLGCNELGDYLISEFKTRTGMLYFLLE